MKHITIVFLFSIQALFSFSQSSKHKPEIGIVQEYQNDSLLYASGYHYLIESVAKCLSPLNFSDEDFEKNLLVFRKLKLSIYALNIFMPGDMKLVGPDVNEESILKYSRAVFERCKRAGIKMVVWGSGGARRVPDGFDHMKAKEQFIAVARKVAEVAKEYDIRLALENLNSTETNFINTVDEALKIVKAVNHPNLRLCADIYHMLMEREPAAILEQTKGYLIHCDIAERDGRTPPGVHGDDFSAYLKALHKVKYSGLVVLECRWDNVVEQARSARVNLQQQIDQAYR